MSRTLARTVEPEARRRLGAIVSHADAATCTLDVPLDVANASDAIVRAREYLELRAEMAEEEQDASGSREDLAPARIDAAVSLLLAYQIGGLSIGRAWPSARAWGVPVTALFGAPASVPELGLSPDGRLWTIGSPTRVNAFAGVLELGLVAILLLPSSGLVMAIGGLVAACGVAGMIPPSPWRDGQRGVRASDVADVLEGIVARVERAVRETRERATVRGLVGSAQTGAIPGASRSGISSAVSAPYPRRSSRPKFGTSPRVAGGGSPPPALDAVPTLAAVGPREKSPPVAPAPLTSEPPRVPHTPRGNHMPQESE